jgi:putative transposase
LSGVRLLISDDHPGLKTAPEARFPGVPWQRCQFHLQQNAAHYVQRIEMRREVAADLCAIFESTDRLEAERQAVDKYAHRAPKLSAWMQTNVAETFTVFAFPETHRRRLRASNLMEQISKELKRRTRVATLFLNEASLLPLVSAVFMEISEEWKTEKTYLRMDNLNSPERD